MGDIAMDIEMPDADQFDRDQTPTSPSPFASPEPSVSPEPPNTPAPSSSPALSNDIDDQGEGEEDEPQQPDPNDLYKGDTKKYDSGTLVVVDATEQGPVYAHKENESAHKRNAHLIEMAMREFTDFSIRKICLPPGSTGEDFKAAADGILAGKTKKDLVIWHYHGNAGGVETNYRWRFQGHPRHINAWDFINKLCNSAPDSMILIDTYMHTKIQNKRKLRTGNVEMLALQGKYQNLAGHQIHTHEGYLTEAVCRNLRSWLQDVRTEDVFKAAGRGLITIPQIMAKDYLIPSSSRPLWLSKSGKGRKELCLRFKINPLRTWRAKKLVFESYCEGPERPPPVVTSSEVGEDEGFEEMEESESVVDSKFGGGSDDGDDGDGSEGGQGGDGSERSGDAGSNGEGGEGMDDGEELFVQDDE